MPRSITALIPAIVLAAGLSLAGAAGASASPGHAGLTLQVTGGSIVGAERNGILEFLGVPYAAPPIAHNRFRPPQPVVPWKTVRPATTHGSACPQTSSSAAPVGKTSENCLFLDVYAPPSASGTRLPVMVFVHGGGYLQGSVTQYDPSPLARSENVIVVEMNYRLGALGFMSLPAQARETGRAGNLGLLDQQQSLRWVKNNISAFGGDPANVTLFGESAGGGSVCNQLASPDTVSLIHKAIVQSGGCSGTGLVPASRATGERRSLATADRLGCPAAASDVSGQSQLSCLRRLPVATIVADPSNAFTDLSLGWGPILDGATLRQTPDDAFASGVSRSIPVMQGSNRDEGRFFVATQGDLTLRFTTPDSYRAYVRSSYPADAARILARYPAGRYASPAAAKAAVITDSLFACPSLRSAEASKAGGGMVWQYEYRGTVPLINDLDPLFLPDGGLRSFHGAELFSLFDTVAAIPSPIATDRAQFALARRMRSIWGEFARSGTPFGPGRQSADSTVAASAVLRLDPFSGDISFRQDEFARDHSCSLWSSINP